MRGTALLVAFAFSAVLFVWTFGSVDLILMVERPPALDPVGVVRTLMFAPGYVAFLLAAVLTNLGVLVDPGSAAGILATALSALSSLGIIRAFAGPA